MVQAMVVLGGRVGCLVPLHIKPRPRNPTTTNFRNWPGPGFPRGLRKLTLAGRAVAPKVSFLAPPRTHAGGQLRVLLTGGFRAFHRRRFSARTRETSARNQRQLCARWRSGPPGPLRPLSGDRDLTSTCTCSALKASDFAANFSRLSTAISCVSMSISAVLWRSSLSSNRTVWRNCVSLRASMLSAVITDRDRARRCALAHRHSCDCRSATRCSQHRDDAGRKLSAARIAAPPLSSVGSGTYPRLSR